MFKGHDASAQITKKNIICDSLCPPRPQSLWNLTVLNVLLVVKNDEVTSQLFLRSFRMSDVKRKPK